MAQDVIPGLEGIPIAESSISFVDGQASLLEYRGISIEELGEASTFEETSHLLLFGKLPTATELGQFKDELCHHRRLKYRIIDLIKCQKRPPWSPHSSACVEATNTTCPATS